MFRLPARTPSATLASAFRDAARKRQVRAMSEAEAANAAASCVLHTRTITTDKGFASAIVHLFEGTLNAGRDRKMDRQFLIRLLIKVFLQMYSSGSRRAVQHINIYVHDQFERGAGHI